MWQFLAVIIILVGAVVYAAYRIYQTLKYENEAKYPGEVIKVKSFHIQGVARHVIKSL